MYLIVVLICMSLITNGAVHLFIIVWSFLVLLLCNAWSCYWPVFLLGYLQGGSEVLGRMGKDAVLNVVISSVLIEKIFEQRYKRDGVSPAEMDTVYPLNTSPHLPHP